MLTTLTMLKKPTERNEPNVPGPRSEPTRGSPLRGRRAPTRAARLALAVGGAGALLAGCLNIITADQAYADEFAEFQENGGRCAVPVTVDVDVDYSEATSYRWLSYTGALGEVVSPRGRVYYDELLGDPELLAHARGTLAHLATLDPRNLPSHEEKLAFWMNAYNALVLVAAADGYAGNPAFRVDDGAIDFFNQTLHTIGGELYSLNTLEHGVLRGTDLHPSVFFLDEDEKQRLLDLSDDLWGGRPFDPRVHFAINCASSSCPPLLSRAFRGATVEADLEALTDAFLHDAEKGAGPDGISQLFDFYYDDFEVAGGAEAFIARYRDVSEVNLFAYLPYDWSLNIDTPGADLE